MTDDNDIEREAIDAVNRRFNLMLRQESYEYRQRMRRIEMKRYRTIQNAKKCRLFAQYMIERHGKKSEVE